MHSRSSLHVAPHKQLLTNHAMDIENPLEWWSHREFHTVDVTMKKMKARKSAYDTTVGPDRLQRRDGFLNRGHDSGSG